MKRNYLSLIIVFLFVLVFVSPAYAIFCAKCGASNADDSSFCTNCGASLLKTEEKPDIYSQSRTLFDQGEYDQVISLLSDYCSTSGELKASIVLSNAYLEKCLILKESGDKRYKTLVHKPFAFGKKLLKMHLELLSEGLYICAKSFYVNDRANRASRYIKKAIKFHKPSTSPISDVDYYFLSADVYSALARQKRKGGGHIVPTTTMPVTTKSVNPRLEVNGQ